MNISGDIFLFVNTYSTLKIQQQQNTFKVALYLVFISWDRSKSFIIKKSFKCIFSYCVDLWNKSDNTID